MVGPLLLLKLMHCRKKCETLSSKKDTVCPTTSDTSYNESHTSKKFDKSPPVCRICLKKGDIPVFGKDKSENIAEALVLFGGIDIKRQDKYPKHLCSSCHALLQGAILFRKTAQKSDQILKKSSVSEQDDEGDDSSGMEFDNDSFDFHIPVENEIHEVHQTTAKYHCRRCDLPFETFKDYHEHRMSEEHERSRRTCRICNKSFTAKYFNKHMQVHTRDSPSHICDVCGKTFIVQGQLTRHRLTHFYELPFKCALCPYRGRFTESLRLHMRSHTGEKPYPCSECPARFICKSNLTKHMRTHSRAHDFKCERCGRGFYTQKTLDMHLRIDHTGIKDHICNICGKAFGYRKQMMKHQLKVHKRQKLRSGRLPLYLQVEEMKEIEKSAES